MSNLLNLLLIEDSESDAGLILRLLHKAGYDVHAHRVEIAAEMQAALARQAWDVVICDHHLPEFDAPSALALLQQTGLDIPFIIVSGTIDEEMAVTMMKAGAHDYLKKDRLARLAPAVARELRDAHDRRARRQADAALRRRDAILNAISFAAELLLSHSHFAESVDAVLARLGEATQVSRVYIFENRPDAQGRLLTSQRYEWVAAGVTPQLANPDLQDFPLAEAGFGRWVATLGADQPLYGLVSDFPAAERPVLEAQSILAIAIVPIFVAGAWWGFIGFDECAAQRVWSAAQIEALKMAGRTLGAAIQRGRTEARLRENQARYRSVTESAHDAIITADRDGVIVDWNRGAQQLFGYAASEMIGQPLSRLMPMGYRDAHQRGLARVSAGGDRRVIGKTVERHGVRQDGREFPLELSLATWETGQGVYFTAILRDITERKEREEHIRSQLAELQAWYDVTLDREDRVLTLKGEVNDLLRRLGEPVRYSSAGTE